MDIQSEDFVGAFKLYPMVIPGWQDSVLPVGVAHGGIPHGIYQEPKGLLMVIDPQITLSKAMAAYDSVVVWVNGKETSVRTFIEPGKEGDRIALYLPTGFLLNGINELFYRWKRPSGNYEDSDPILKVLYHDPAPGYPAPTRIVVTHPASVGPTEAAQGVAMTFDISFKRQYDEVTLKIGIWSRTITVTDPAQPLSLTLTAQDFQQIGDNPQMPISARVVDQLGNNNLSATTFMDIHASESRYVVAFLNGPYSVAPGGRVKDIELSLTREGQGMAGTLSVILPAGTVYPDGAGGARDFTTQTDGTLTISGVRGASTSGVYTLTASNGSVVATTALTVMAYGPFGPIAVGPMPTGVTLSPDGALAYVTGNGSVQIIDTASSRLLNLIPLPSLVVSWEIALNHNASRAFACNGNNAVTVIDTASGALISNISVPGHPIGIVMSKDGLLAFVSTWVGNTVAVIDTVNLVVVRTILVGIKPRGIDITPDGNRVFVVNNGTDTGTGCSLSIIDTRTFSVIQTVQMKFPPYGVAIAPDGNSLFVAGGTTNTQGSVAQFNAHTLAEVRTIAFSTYPRGIVVNNAGTRAYVCDATSNRLFTIDTATGGIIATTPVGYGSAEIAITRDDSRAYVTSFYDNTVWSISLLPGVSGLEGHSAEESSIMTSDSRPWVPFPGDVF
jgi:YVTN family beta-propeller protein